MRVKSPGVPPGLANARPPGRSKLAKAPPLGLTRLANAPRLPGGGWAQVELTDALSENGESSCRFLVEKQLKRNKAGVSFKRVCERLEKRLN